MYDTGDLDTYEHIEHVNADEHYQWADVFNEHTPRGTSPLYIDILVNVKTKKGGSLNLQKSWILNFVCLLLMKTSANQSVANAFMYIFSYECFEANQEKQVIQDDVFYFLNTHACCLYQK